MATQAYGVEFIDRGAFGETGVYYADAVHCLNRASTLFSNAVTDNPRIQSSGFSLFSDANADICWVDTHDVYKKTLRAQTLTTDTVWVLPAAGGTLQTSASAEFSDAIFTVNDGGDTTRRMRLDVPAYDSGTARVYALPNLTTAFGTTDTIVTATFAQTLTNKALQGTATQPSSAVSLTTLSIGDATSTVHACVLNIIADQAVATLATSYSLTIDVNASSRTLDLGGNIVTGGAFTTTGGAVTLTAIAATNASFPAAGTITLVDTATTQTLSNKVIRIRDATASVARYLTLVVDQATSTLPADYNLTFDVNEASRTITLGGNLVLAAGLTTASNAGTLTFGASTNATFPAGAITLVDTTTAQTITNKLITTQATGIRLTDASSTAGSYLSLIADAATATVANQSLTFDTNETSPTISILGSATFHVNLNAASRTVDLGGNLVLAAGLTTAANAGTLTFGAATNATFPAGAITVMDLSTAQTVTGTKIYNDDGLVIRTSGDSTNLARFDVPDFDSTVVRVFNFPNLVTGGTTDTVVVEGSSTFVQTLTYKTLNSTTNTIAADKMRIAAGATVDFTSSSAPGVGYLLTATSGTTATWQAPNSTDSAIWGRGGDGDVTITAASVLTRDMYYNSLVIDDVVLESKGFAIYVNSSIHFDISGVITCNGGAGSTSTAGAPPHSVDHTLGGSGAGGAGRASGPGVGTAAASVIYAAGGSGGAGGQGDGTNVGGAGGTAIAPPISAGGVHVLTQNSNPFTRLRTLNGVAVNGGAGGGGGGALTGAAYGGGGGAGGGVILLVAKTITNPTTAHVCLSANGGAGAAGDPGGNTGGGGGGGGGVIVVISTTDTTALANFTTPTVNGGAGGALGGTGTGGAPGSAGVEICSCT